MKIKSVIVGIGLLMTLFFASCVDFDDETAQSYSQLCETSYYGDDYLFTSDFGEKFLAKSLPAEFEFEEGKRVLILFSQYTENDIEGSDYDYLIVPTEIAEVTTKDIIFINDENRDTLGSDGVTFNSINVAGNYINVSYYFGASGKVSHYFNMSFDSDSYTSNDTIQLTFHHKAYEDSYTNSYSGFLSFDLRSLGEFEPTKPYVISLNGVQSSGETLNIDLSLE